MPDYQRVLLDTGAKITVGFVRDGMKVIDEPAVDRRGRPLRDEPAPSAKAAVTRAAKKTPARRAKRAAANKAAASPETPPPSDPAAGSAASTSEEDSQ